MKIILLAIVMLFTSFTTVVKKKLWVCATIVDVPPNIKLHVTAIVSAKDFNEARKKYLHYVMYKVKKARGGVIDTDEDCLMIEEFTENLIID